MNPTRPSGLLGGAGTFALLLVAGFSWFMSVAYAGPTRTLLWSLSWVAPTAAVLAVLLFGLTVRSLLTGSSGTRSARRAIR